MKKAARMTIEEELLKLRQECRYLRQRVACLERAHLAQKKKSNRLQELLKERNRFIRELEKEKEALEKLIGELKRQKDIYKGMIFKASKRSRSTLRSAQANQAKKRSVGGQKGHKGHGRKLPKRVDQVKRVYFHHCPCCHTPLKRSKSIVPHTVEDIPFLEQIQPIVTTYEQERQWCPKCKKEVVAVPDKVVPKSRLGMNLIIKTLISRHLFRQPFASIAKDFKIFYNIDVKKSSLVNILKRAQEWLGQDYDELLKEIRNSPVKQADETGWRINGLNCWCWAFLTKNSAYYTIEHTRGKGVPERILSASDRKDVLVRDDYQAYGKLDLNHQSCWAHLLRKSREAAEAEDASKEVHRLYQKLKSVYQDLVNITNQPFHFPSRQEAYQKRWQELEKIINNHYQEDDTKRIQTRIRNQGKNLLTALLFKDVPLTNNLAERLLRPMVVTRKISGGSRSDKGAMTHAVNMSIIQTISLRNQPIIPTLRKMLFKGALSPPEKTE